MAQFIQAVADLKPSGLERMVACEILPAEGRERPLSGLGA